MGSIGGRLSGKPSLRLGESQHPTVCAPPSSAGLSDDKTECSAKLAPNDPWNPSGSTLGAWGAIMGGHGSSSIACNWASASATLCVGASCHGAKAAMLATEFRAEKKTCNYADKLAR